MSRSLCCVVVSLLNCTCLSSKLNVVSNRAEESNTAWLTASRASDWFSRTESWICWLWWSIAKRVLCSVGDTSSWAFLRALRFVLLNSLISILSRTLSWPPAPNSHRVSQGWHFRGNWWLTCHLIGRIPHLSLRCVTSLNSPSEFENNACARFHPTSWIWPCCWAIFASLGLVTRGSGETRQYNQNQEYGPLPCLSAECSSCKSLCILIRLWHCLLEAQLVLCISEVVLPAMSAQESINVPKCTGMLWAWASRITFSFFSNFLRCFGLVSSSTYPLLVYRGFCIQHLHRIGYRHMVSERNHSGTENCIICRWCDHGAIPTCFVLPFRVLVFAARKPEDAPRAEQCGLHHAPSSG